MTLNADSVTQALFSALIGPAAVAPLAPAFPINLPLNFSLVKNIKVFTGTWTPHENYLYLQNSFQNDDAPNWLIVVCDSQLNLTMPGTFINDVAFKRFAFLSWVNNPASLPQSLYLEGRTLMPQDVACDYTIIIGQGDIS